MREDTMTGAPHLTSTDPACGVRRGKFSAQPRAHYDRVTDAWQYLIGDDLHVGYFEDQSQDLLNATQALTRYLADFAQLVPGSKVLDIGCGTGNPAIYLALERGCRVVGISNSGVGIERAKARAAEKGAEDRVVFNVADGTATGCADESFDCVWVMESSHLIPQKDLLIQECARALRSGGTAVLCDLMLRRPMPARPGVALCHHLMLLEEVYGKANLQSIESYVRQFEAGGIDAEGHDISEQVCPTFAHWRRNAEKHANRVSEILGAEQVDRFIRSCDIMTHLFGDGQLGYCIVAGNKRG